MSDKLSGLVLIINTLLPAVFVVLLLGVGFLLWQDFNRHVGPTLDKLTGNFETLKTKADEARTTVESVVKEVGAVVGQTRQDLAEGIDDTEKALEPLAAPVNKLRNSIDEVVTPITAVKVLYPTLTRKTGTFKGYKKHFTGIGTIDIPSFDYLTGVTFSTRSQTPFDRLAEPFEDINEALNTVSAQVDRAKVSGTRAVESIRGLAPLISTFAGFKAEFESVHTSLVGLADSVRGALVLMGWVFGIFALLAAPWLAISYVTWSLRRLKRGYALLVE